MRMNLVTKEPFVDRGDRRVVATPYVVIIDQALLHIEAPLHQAAVSLLTFDDDF